MSILDNRMITVAINEVCNLNCSYCFLTPDRRFRRDMTSDEVAYGMQLVDDIVKAIGNRSLGVVSILTTEATMYSAIDLAAIVNKFMQVALKVSIQTNGQRIAEDAEYIELFSGLVDRNRVAFGVSIDGCEEVHDKARGKGTFRKALLAETRILDRGMACGCTCVITNESLKYQAEITKFVSNRDRVAVSYLKPTFRGVVDEQAMERARFTRELKDSLNTRKILHCEDISVAYNRSVSTCSDVVNGEYTLQDLGGILDNREAMFDKIAVECVTCEHIQKCDLMCHTRRDSNGYAYNCVKKV